MTLQEETKIEKQFAKWELIIKLGLTFFIWLPIFLWYKIEQRIALDSIRGKI